MRKRPCLSLLQIIFFGRGTLLNSNVKVRSILCADQSVRTVEFEGTQSFASCCENNNFRNFGGGTILVSRGTKIQFENVLISAQFSYAGFQKRVAMIPT